MFIMNYKNKINFFYKIFYKKLKKSSNVKELKFNLLILKFKQINKIIFIDV